MGHTADVQWGPGRQPAKRAVRAGILALLMAVAGAGACNEWITEFEPDPESIPLRDIIHLTRAGGRTAPLAADGAASDTLLARLPADASTRVVTFTTTAGTFPLTASREAAVRAERDDADPERRLVARIVLRADTLPAVAVVSAKVADFRDTLSVAFVR